MFSKSRELFVGEIYWEGEGDKPTVGHIMFLEGHGTVSDLYTVVAQTWDNAIFDNLDDFATTLGGRNGHSELTSSGVLIF